MLPRGTSFEVSAMHSMRGCSQSTRVKQYVLDVSHPGFSSLQADEAPQSERLDMQGDQ
jgi:hypothetical protein